MDSRERWRRNLRWTVWWGILAAAILIPFLLFGEEIEAFTSSFLLRSAENRSLMAFFLGGLLALDVFLPVPSSLASTACGHYLGFTLGLLTSTLGMTLGAVSGYIVGLTLGRGAANRFVGEQELERLESGGRRLGGWMVAAFRPVPVLAEASVVYAGMVRMPWGRFLAIGALSNLGVSAAYAGIGAYAADANSFLLAFLASMIVPGLAMGAARIADRGRGRGE